MRPRERNSTPKAADTTISPRAQRVCMPYACTMHVSMLSSQTLAHRNDRARPHPPARRRRAPLSRGPCSCDPRRPAPRGDGRHVNPAELVTGRRVGCDVRGRGASSEGSLPASKVGEPRGGIGPRVMPHRTVPNPRQRPSHRAARVVVKAQSVAAPARPVSPLARQAILPM